MHLSHASIHAGPHPGSLTIVLSIHLGMFLLLASIAGAEDLATSMPASSLSDFETTTPAQTSSAFAVMAAMALQDSLGSASDPSSGRASLGDFISVTPRVWITQVNLTESEGFDSEAVIVPMYGGSITITPPSAPNFSILATGFYGEGKGEAFGRDADVRDGDSEVTRTDIEILLRYHIPETQLVVFGGPRYVTFDTSFEFSSFDVDLTSKIWVVEMGVGAFANITESGRHRAFGNFTLGVAFEEFESKTDNDILFEGSESQTTATIDLNLGYQYLLTDTIGFNFRYRMFTIFTEDDFAQGDLTTIHGPELGLALRF